MSLTKITCPDHMYIPPGPSIGLSPRRASDVETRARGRSPRVTPLVPLRRRVFLHASRGLRRRAHAMTDKFLDEFLAEDETFPGYSDEEAEQG